jgi:hypothetical protein
MHKRKTKAQILAQCQVDLKAMLSETDYESVHSRADMILLDALAALGQSEIVAAYKELDEKLGFRTA